MTRAKEGPNQLSQGDKTKTGTRAKDIKLHPRRAKKWLIKVS